VKAFVVLASTEGHRMTEADAKALCAQVGGNLERLVLSSKVPAGQAYLMEPWQLNEGAL
jgi:hypothetical protein